MEIPKAAIDIINKLGEASYEAYFVGGCVRDMLMGIEPKDWDITTSAAPEQIKSLLKRTVDTGIKHGTVTIVASGKNYEVTTYRLDGEYLNFRHPEQVIFTSDLKEDLRRRDFTVNAIAYHPTGGYIDFFEGTKDIEAKTIRGVGDASERFREDALRMLRAVRFACQLGFSIEDNTFEALKKNSELIAHVSMERIRDELVKAFTSEHVSKAVYFTRCTILNHALPFLADYLDGHFGGFLERLEKLQMPERTCVNALALLFKDMESTEAAKTLRLLKMDNATARDISLISKEVNKEIPSDLYYVKKTMANIGVENYFALLNCKIACGENVKPLKELGTQALERGEPIFIKDMKINGNVLKERFGVSGVEVGMLLNALHEEVLKDFEKNNEAALIEAAMEILTNRRS